MASLLFRGLERIELHFKNKNSKIESDLQPSKVNDLSICHFGKLKVPLVDFDTKLGSSIFKKEIEKKRTVIIK